MGFLDSATKFFQSVGDFFDDGNDTVSQHAREWRSKSDEELVAMLQHHKLAVLDGNELAAVQKILRDRYPDSHRYNEIIQQYWDTEHSKVSSRFLRV